MKTSTVVGSKMAAMLLFGLVMAIAVSPRIRFIGGETTADLRLQDVLLVPIIIFLLATRQGSQPSLRLVTGRLVVPVLLAAGIVSAVAIVAMPEVSPLRRVAFYGRGVELFALAAAVAGLWLRARDRALPALTGAMITGAIANFAWVLYQLASQQIGTLIGTAVSDTVESYGPKLIGEPSAFGTGQYFAAVAAFGIALLRAKYGRWPAATFLIAVGAVGAYVANSRISIGSILVASILLLVLNRGKVVLNPFAVTQVILVGGAAAVLVLPRLTGRLSEQGLEAGLGVRANGIWDVALSEALKNPLLGVGPGGLITPLPIEAHNIFIRSIADYGVLVGPLFLVIFVVALVRAFRTLRQESVSIELSLTSHWAFFVLLSTLISGSVQDSLTGVMSSHFAMVSMGVYAAALFVSNKSTISSIDFDQERSSLVGKRTRLGLTRTAAK